jgi:hypothetical protein
VVFATYSVKPSPKIRTTALRLLDTRTGSSARSFYLVDRDADHDLGGVYIVEEAPREPAQFSTFRLFVSRTGSRRICTTCIQLNWVDDPIFPTFILSNTPPDNLVSKSYDFDTVQRPAHSNLYDFYSIEICSHILYDIPRSGVCSQTRLHRSAARTTELPPRCLSTTLQTPRPPSPSLSVSTPVLFPRALAGMVTGTGPSLVARTRLPGSRPRESLSRPVRRPSFSPRRPPRPPNGLWLSRTKNQGRDTTMEAVTVGQERRGHGEAQARAWHCEMGSRVASSPNIQLFSAMALLVSRPPICFWSLFQRPRRRSPLSTQTQDMF